MSNYPRESHYSYLLHKGGEQVHSPLTPVKVAGGAVLGLMLTYVGAKYIKGLVDSALTSAPLDVDVPKDKKGRVKIHYKFEPGTGTQPEMDE